MREIEPSAKEQTFDMWRVMSPVIAIIVATLSVVAWLLIEQQAGARNSAYLQSLINDTQAVLRDRYHVYEEALRGGVGLYYASQSVERQEWRNYIKALNVAQNLPGINGIGYIDYVPEDRLEDYLEHTRADDIPDFRNHPETSHADKFIIKFIEPLAPNEEAVGLDIGFEPNRRAAAERARDSGHAALTEKILLVQDHKKQAGFLLLLPVYTTNNTPTTVEARRAHFQGWVYAPFIGPNFFQGVSNANKNQLYLEVFDGEEPSPDALIYVDPGYVHGDYHHPEGEKYEEKDEYYTKMEIAGRTWTLEWHPNDNFKPPANEHLGLIMLVIGLSFALMLYYTLKHLINSKAVIARKVTEKTLELNETNLELKRSNHELERFAYIASHDLQEPLRKIGGFTERLERHMGQQIEEDEKAQTYMNFISDGVVRMRELINGLLAYSRVTTSEIRSQKLDANEIARAACENLSESIAENKAEIFYHNLPCVYYDKIMLTQIFQNLIGNALKYRSSRTPVVKIAAKAKNSMWEFYISDNGIGMEDKYLERIFEMFQRLHRKEEIEGTGIGLSLCQKIIERYGGTIRVESVPGKGSTFFFTIPRHEGESSAPAP